MLILSNQENASVKFKKETSITSGFFVYFVAEEKSAELRQKKLRGVYR
jgi:Uri superfamily endonuclease